MKRLFIILILVFIIFSVFKVNANSSFSLIGKIIVLDAGHGGVDNGATSGKYNEKDINLSIVIKLKKELESEGATVILTRTSDKDLSEEKSIYRKKSDFDNRIKIINNSHADLYISIHLNKFHSSLYYGPQVFYVKDNKNIAEIFQTNLNKFTKTTRKVKTINNVYMYNKLNIKGILIECGFMSNLKELSLLTNDKYQKEISKVISKSVIEYLN